MSTDPTPDAILPGSADSAAEREQRLAYLGLSPADAARLVEIGREVEDLIDPAVERFYVHLRQFPVQKFLESEEVLARLKGFQRRYLRELFSGRYDGAYFESRYRIGEAHVRIGLEPQWHLGGYGIYRDSFVPRILERFGAGPDHGASHLLAFDKVLLLDSELALDAYIWAYTRKLRELQSEVLDRNLRLEEHSASLESAIEARTRELRMSEEKYRGIVDNAADAIILVDEEDRIRSWNRGAALMFGYAAEEIVGQGVAALVPEGAGKELDFLRAELRRAGSIRNFETVRVAKDGRRVFVSITRTQLRNELGQPIGSSAIVRDITAMRSFEERMHKAERVASLGWLASEIAHEVGTPLNVISGRAEHLLNGMPVGDPRRKPLEIIVSQIDRISRVVRRALQIVRDPAAGSGEPLVASVLESAKEVLEFFEVKLVSRRISILCDVAADAPKLALNRIDLEQILFNLIQNAIDAMPRGGSLQISMRLEGDEALIAIADTGTGIAPENIQRIFEPLFTTKETEHGTGLGLALVSRIVKRHRGSISVQSDPGRGSTFTVRLPIADQ
ncbi:MAG: protoglobin domain-containing protein [Acidobacteriota bacterium]